MHCMQVGRGWMVLHQSSTSSFVISKKLKVAGSEEMTYESVCVSNQSDNTSEGKNPPSGF